MPENIENNLDGTFDLVNSNYGNISEGVQVSPTLSDLNNDGILDILIGNRRGGLSLFKSNLKVDGTTEIGNFEEDFDVNIYPNPVQGNSFFVEINNLSEHPFSIELFDLNGQIIYQKSVDENYGESLKMEIPSTDLSNGIYYMRVLDFYNVKSKKIIVSN